MRRMVVQRSDLYDVGQRRRARLGTRSDISYETKAATRRCGGFCVARFVQPGAVLRRLSYLFGTPSRRLFLVLRFCAGSGFAAAAGAARRTTRALLLAEASGSGPSIHLFQSLLVEGIHRTERTRRGQYKPQVAAAQDSS